MGRSNGGRKQCYISVPSQIISSISSSSLQSLLSPPKKPISKRPAKLFSLTKSPKFWLLSLFFCASFGMLKLFFNLDPLTPLFPNLCSTTPRQQQEILSLPILKSESGVGHGREDLISDVRLSLASEVGRDGNGEQRGAGGDMRGEEEEKSGFWKQPDGLGYRPCLNFSNEYRRVSEGTLKDRTKYLMVVVNGGMNQQRNQIVDAVVIARILGAALVVPVLQVNVIWGDESEFADIFDLEHFKRVLANDVRVVSSLPSTYLRKRPVEESRTPIHASPQWIRQHYHGRLRRDGVLLLRGLDSRLSKDLPSDLQKLRCKVAFQALKFAPQILELGNKIAERMQSEGPYIALHLRLERDVWVRTGCSPGLSPEFDEIVNNYRRQHPELLTAKSNLTAHERKLEGLCPLNALEVARLLKALGAPRSARIYWAGGQPLGGKEALLPLTREFPHLYNKEDLALPGELEPFAKRASSLAAIDFIVCEKSDVFMPSHGGNMGHAIQGHRAYAGHRKYITPNKRHMLPYFLNSSLPEAEFIRIVKELHREALGQPELRTTKAGRDVTKYPVPECMCNDANGHSSG
ncbi:O-fucosyltransferase 20 [Ancistrocladus abbreviatus]